MVGIQPSDYKRRIELTIFQDIQASAGAKDNSV
jgi:hypothetical protein